MTREIAVIDISPIYKDQSSEQNRLAKKAIVEKFAHACSTDGFLQVVGHQISSQQQDAFLTSIKSFFDLPLREKVKLDRKNTPSSRGYEQAGEQNLNELDEESLADAKEGFSAGYDREPDGRLWRGPNQWPEESSVPQFRTTYESYFKACERLSKDLFGLMALSLGLAEDYFYDFTQDAVSCLRSHRYRPPPTVIPPGYRGTGPHTDFGAMTLLLQDSVGGLEVWDRDMQVWLPVIPIEGAYVV